MIDDTFFVLPLLALPETERGHTVLTIHAATPQKKDHIERLGPIGNLECSTSACQILRIRFRIIHGSW